MAFSQLVILRMIKLETSVACLLVCLTNDFCWWLVALSKYWILPGNLGRFTIRSRSRFGHSRFIANRYTSCGSVCMSTRCVNIKINRFARMWVSERSPYGLTDRYLTTASTKDVMTETSPGKSNLPLGDTVYMACHLEKVQEGQKHHTVVSA
jgi:hypothetical protein